MIAMPITRERSLEEMLFHWNSVCNRAKDDWTKGFALSIAAASKRRHWKPTPKQLGIMQRMVSDLFVHWAADTDDGKVIE